MVFEQEARILSKVLHYLESLISDDENEPEPTEFNMKFYCKKQPHITIPQYSQRIFKYSHCSPQCAVLALIYINQFLRNTASSLNPFNVHRIIIVAFMLADKFLHDEHLDNYSYACIGGISLREVNTLEREFLQSLNFSLHVRSEIFEEFYHSIVVAP